MNRMTKYNGKALLLTRQMVKDGNTTYYSAYYNGKWVDYVNSYALKNTVTKDTYQGWGTYEDTFTLQILPNIGDMTRIKING